MQYLFILLLSIFIVGENCSSGKKVAEVKKNVFFVKIDVSKTGNAIGKTIKFKETSVTDIKLIFSSGNIFYGKVVWPDSLFLSTIDFQIKQDLLFNTYIEMIERKSTAFSKLSNDTFDLTGLKVTSVINSRSNR